MQEKLEANQKFDSTKYKNDFAKENYDRINLVMPKGRKEIIKKTAKAKGQSVNEFINLAIEEKLGK